MDAIGPDTPPLGEINQSNQLYQNQLATTVAFLLGVDFEKPKKAGQAIHLIID